MKSLQSIPKTWMYVILLVVLAGPLLKPIGIPIRISNETENSYKVIDSLAPGSVVVFGFDYTPGNAAEMEPQALAVLKHLLTKDVKVIGISFLAQGPMLAEKALAITGWSDREYGVDYVNLGYRAGGQGAVAAFAADVVGTFNTDYSGNPSSSLPIMKGIKTAGDVDMIITIAPGTPGPEDYVRQVYSTYKTRLVCGVPAVAITQVAPYVQARQVEGILGGLPGAAEYELLMNQPGKAVAAMDAQSLAHLLIIVLIILRNIPNIADVIGAKPVSAGTLSEARLEARLEALGDAGDAIGKGVH